MRVRKRRDQQQRATDNHQPETGIQEKSGATGYRAARVDRRISRGIHRRVFYRDGRISTWPGRMVYGQVIPLEAAMSGQESPKIRAMAASVSPG
jgi:hypothetical protein